MQLWKKRNVSFLLLALMVFLLAACAPQEGNTQTTQTANETPLEAIQKSVEAMKQLKSAHLELQANNQVKNPIQQTPQSMPTTAQTQDITIQVKGNGDVSMPDQAKINYTLSSGKQNAQLVQIMKGNKVYIQNQQGKWYVLDKEVLMQQAGIPGGPYQLDQQSMLGLLQHAKIKDQGIQSLRGENMRHISADLDKEAFKELLRNSPQLKGYFGQQDIETVIDKTKSFNSTVDVWIDQNKHYVRRTEMKVNMALDPSAISNQSTQKGDITSTSDLVIDLSKFDEPVTITPPEQATPTNNLQEVLGIPQEPQQ
ncbi:uncharacterized protein DUF1396 [Thermosporothrix hazakensis]|jgi:hypothetical protein|uniref:Uncharacterized protein DUF1396 n=1 Tax=Thermosporothrix hazakensis TaxID=644383 RepID=A0A326U0G2_THEHA|nr:DUF6612 family protein [Thermosporothrix hazakensis]PZW22896.1 uncharacterized protein DUF1396 [Thermosporothrix hazakensis]GCE48012.1 hypothetical protein KTH_28810 [Thermosporothrix hazakensis]